MGEIIALLYIHKTQKIDNLTHFQIEIPKRENFYDT